LTKRNKYKELVYNKEQEDNCKVQVEVEEDYKVEDDSKVGTTKRCRTKTRWGTTRSGGQQSG